MGAWTKPPQGLVDLFHDSLPRDGRVSLRRMFGLPCASVNGNLAAGVFQDGVFARLPPETWARLERAFGARPFEPMAGRVSKTYLMLPDEVLADEVALAELLAEAVAATDALPAKAAPERRRASKPRKPRGS